MDALRLRVAARAYRATRAGDAEVEHGVRRALSAMRRSQIRRRASLMPAIIVAILAFGTLAYANPNSVRRWISRLVLGPGESAGQEVGARLGAPRTTATTSAQSAASPAAIAPPSSEAEVVPSVEAVTATKSPAEAVPSPKPLQAGSRASAGRAASAGRLQRATWAEVNAALAAQDPPRALAALRELSRRGDAATRAKAQLGIAQLLWSRGDRAAACGITRTLIQQGSTPERVQERARALDQGCKR